jgi:hypothetical protein
MPPQEGQEQAPEQEQEAPEGGPEQGGQDPIMQIAQVAMQALQNKDCEAAMAVCEAFVKLVQQQQG